MAELIKTTDSLNDGRKKLNDAITDSNAALSTANTAKQTANLAKAESESTQTQLDTIVIEGDSSVEAAQARVNNSGTAFPTLKQRLDAEHQEVTAQLQQIDARKVNQEELQQISLAYKESYATLGELQAAYPNGDSYNHVVLSDMMIYTYNDSWVSTGVQANGTGLADGTVSIKKTTFIILSQNIYDKENADNITGKFLNFAVTPPSQANNADAEISHPIKAIPGQKYVALFDPSFFSANNSRVAFYDKNGTYIDRVTPIFTDKIGVFTMPTIYPQLDHFRLSYKKADKSKLMVVKGETYPSVYQPYPPKLTEAITLNERQKAEVDQRVKTINPLYMQQMEAVGNSIMYGAGDSGRGWPYRLAIKHQMTYNNRAIAGAVIARGVKTSAGADVPSILDQIGQVTGNGMFNLVEGGTNDEDYNVPMGSITQGKTGPFDETTYSGALESAFSQLIAKCHGKKILYIIPQKMGNATWQARRYTRFVRAMEICKKWGIPYINLWDECYLDPTVTALRSAYYSDEQHLNPNGYDLTTPNIENKLMTL